MGNKKYSQDGENAPYSLKLTRPALSHCFPQLPLFTQAVKTEDNSCQALKKAEGTH